MFKRALAATLILLLICATASATRMQSEQAQIAANLSEIGEALLMYANDKLSRHDWLPLDRMDVIVKEYGTPGAGSLSARRAFQKHLTRIKRLGAIGSGLTLLCASVALFLLSRRGYRVGTIQVLGVIASTLVVYIALPHILRLVLAVPAQPPYAYVQEFRFTDHVRWSDPPETVVAMERLNLRPFSSQVFILRLGGRVESIPRAQAESLFETSHGSQPAAATSLPDVFSR